MDFRFIPILVLASAVLVHAVRPSLDVQPQGITASDPKPVDKKHNRKHKGGYSSPTGLFIQERASKQLPGPGQHFSFGAVKPWVEIHEKYVRSGSKLLLVIRHGQAVSNFLGETLGPDEWYGVEQTCSYRDSNDTLWGIFDADLTDLGQAQAQSVNSLLTEVGWFQKMTNGKPTRAVVSPLSRCLETARAALKGVALVRTDVEEYVRETLGEDTCDARRSVTDPEPEEPEEDADGDKVGKHHKKHHKKHHHHHHKKHHTDGDRPCDFEAGLASKFPDFQFQVLGSNKTGLGLISDEDTMWEEDDREKQKHQVKRAKKFLDALFNDVKEEVVFVVTHSGFTRSLLLAVGREPYRPVNAELVPVIVQKDDE